MSAAPLLVAGPGVVMSAGTASASVAGPDAPPEITMSVHRPGTAPGLLFVGPQNPMVATARGPQIVDDRGRPVWFRRLPDGYFSSDFRVQTYRGQRVLTWWEGTQTIPGTGITSGAGYIADSHYRVIAKVEAPKGDPPGMHEFRLTSRGTALVTAYREVPYDLSPVGGAKDGTALDSIVQEIDVQTGEVLLRWSSLAHVPLTESLLEPPPGAHPFDYFHVNSVDVDTDGDLLVSSLNTSTVYKIDRSTGRIIWRLGGRSSTFQLADGARFNRQHDARAVGGDTIRIFDNQGENGLSRVVWIKLDHERRLASLVRQIVHPQVKAAVAEGGAAELPNGNTVVSWGSAGGFSEFSRTGELLLDATFAEGFSTYRAYRFPWHGRPAKPPTVSLTGSAARVVWNGATGVARWRILAGSSRTDLRPVAQAAWDGFDTVAALPSGAASGTRFVKAEALDAGGRVIGVSAVTPAQASGS
ncbi:arylsulfotransferase family protein [Actinomadura miaoliensis]|uniref:arylsulfotransferase family protein n=1 Tax=Actinomadura miaoliensis TaxID=430685 RepID=UPI0031EEA69F